MSSPTREVWLHNIVNAMRPWFDAEASPLPDIIHVSVGFPSRSALSRSKKRIGECWGPMQSSDNAPHVFVSPLLSADRVGDVLVHELVHAAVGVEHGHKQAFGKVAKALGLTGKMTATLPSDALTVRLNALYDNIGPYPHSPLCEGAQKDKKQSTRMIKIYCPADDYVLRGTRKAIAIGVPCCPVCAERMTVDGEEDTSDDSEDSE